MIRILLVDDDDDVRTVLERVLLELGYGVDTASTVTAGLTLLTAHDYDLVVTDAHLPDGSGVAVADAAKSKNVLSIVLTGYARQAPQYAYLFKPIRPDEMVRAVQRYLDSKKSTYPISDEGGGLPDPHAAKEAY